MKKRILPALMTALLLCVCTGCKTAEQARPSVPESIQQPFESTVNIHYQDIDATARIAKEAPGYCKISFTSPEALQDMTVEFTTQEVNVSYQKLQASFRPDSIPGSAISKTLVSAIDAATKENGVRVSYEDGALTITGQSEGGEFQLKLDPEAGNLLTLSVPESDFEATFEDFTLLAQ